MQDKDFLEEETGAAGQPEDDGYYDPEEDPANAEHVDRIRAYLATHFTGMP